MSESIKSYEIELGLERKTQASIRKAQAKHEKGSAMWNYHESQIERSNERIRFINQRLAALRSSN